MQPHTRPILSLALQTAPDFLGTLLVDGHTDERAVFVVERPKATLRVVVAA